MKRFKKFVTVAFTMFLAIAVLTGCDDIITTRESPTGSTKQDIAVQAEVADRLASSQRTPSDIDYSLERYNLIRRAYWVNGQREKADALVCGVEKPLGYIILFAGNVVVGRFVVDGKVSSLNSFLTPGHTEEAYGNSSTGYTTISKETADVDGSYGENDNGIFFFTPDGRYIEWNSVYLYSDVPFEVDDPVIKYEVNDK